MLTIQFKANQSLTFGDTYFNTQENRLSDYRPPGYVTDEVALEFRIFEGETLVKSTLKVRRADDASSQLELDGEDVELLSVAVDGRELSLTISAGITACDDQSTLFFDSLLSHEQFGIRAQRSSQQPRRNHQQFRPTGGRR